eukprot:TRINITY_DN2015_c0_g1_i2.p1 TRINITY_DN2015_c0_g1~~TRINITY_DN2015_c0_g1_i2.p1  ORF type:complete len:482 (-),score=80.35 TRINITY_DN2015_c0_g1_i2:83-1528(-)
MPQGCKWSHDLEKYLQDKPPDLGPTCFLYTTIGKCQYGLGCRYGKEHIKGTENVTNPELLAKNLAEKYDSINSLDRDVQHKLRKRTLRFPAATAFDAAWKSHNQQQDNAAEFNDSKLPPRELKAKREKVDFRNKVMLAPLTTLGNLPFRKMCKKFGADITCGEMALATSVLQGQASEWALLRRDPSEDVFGVQIAGNNHIALSKAAELLSNEIDVDFIDINSCCPIELITRKGAGSALLKRRGRLEPIIRGMTYTTGGIPITIKVRTGKKEDAPYAHTVVEDMAKWGVSAISMHARSQQQRYTKAADWDYIGKCVEIVKPYPCAFIGNGDVYNWREAKKLKEGSGVDSLMLARGALIKPWLFKEIKEQSDWDISATERFSLLQDYVHTGLYHWGSDDKGISTTRTFLLEWLSYLYRYIPVGILERPVALSDRPPKFFGRSDLETLMASPLVSDWMKISEMLLGKAPEGFNFVPKHESNAWG